MKKIALVTGASSGIGEATATRLSDAGFTVYGTSRRGAQGEKRAYEMLPLDVTSDDSVQAAVTAVISFEGRIDLLVNMRASAWLQRVRKKVRSNRRKRFSTRTSSAWSA